MKRRIFVAIVAASGFALFAGAQDAQAFELLNKMMGHRHGHGGCCEPACCEPEPSCCEPAPTCCEPEPTCCEEPSCCDSCGDSCCKKRHGWWKRLMARHRCRKPACCEPACEPACCEPEPSCCSGH